MRSRDSARTAALQAEVVALRSLVVELRAELTALRAQPAAPAPALEEAGPGWVTLQLPLVKLAAGMKNVALSAPESSRARVRQAMLAHPLLVSGERRLDYDLVAKGGALLRGWPGGLDAPTLDRRLRELVLADQP